MRLTLPFPSPPLGGYRQPSLRAEQQMARSPTPLVRTGNIWPPKTALLLATPGSHIVSDARVRGVFHKVYHVALNKHGEIDLIVGENVDEKP